MEEMGLAMQIWHAYKSMVQENLESVLEVVVSSFVNSPYLIEVKHYFLSHTIHYLSYEHIDRVLASIEERF